MFMEVKNFEALKEAMKELCDFLAESDVPEDSVFDSKLVVSELVSNVLQHSDGVASLESEIRGEFIELKVRSSVRFCPPEESRCSEVYAESGRGLFIVDNVCTERSFTEDGGIKVLIKISAGPLCPTRTEGAVSGKRALFALSAGKEVKNNFGRRWLWTF